MKYLVFVLVLIPFYSNAQQNCKYGAIHFNVVLDNLPVTPEVQAKVDSAQNGFNKALLEKKKTYEKKYRSKAEINKLLKKESDKNNASLLELKRKWMQKVYIKKINAAQLQIYDKGKRFDSVMNADSPNFAKLPPGTCDVTEECLKLVKEMVNSGK